MLPIIAQSDKRYICPKAMNIIDNNVYIFTNVMHVPPLKIAFSVLAPSSPRRFDKIYIIFFCGVAIFANNSRVGSILWGHVTHMAGPSPTVLLCCCCGNGSCSRLRCYQVLRKVLQFPIWRFLRLDPKQSLATLLFFISRRPLALPLPFCSRPAGLKRLLGKFLSFEEASEVQKFFVILCQFERKWWSSSHDDESSDWRKTLLKTLIAHQFL